MLERIDRRSDRTRPPQPPRTSSGGSRAGNGVIVLANRAPFTHERAATVASLSNGPRAAWSLPSSPFSTPVPAPGWRTAPAAPTLVGVDRGGLNVPRTAPQYRLRYVHLAEEEHRGYYYGFANEALWPLCHAVGVPPVFRPDDFRRYQAANGQFAAAVAEEGANRAPVVLVQDYHFALAPRLVRDSCRRARSSPSGTSRGRGPTCSAPARGRESCWRGCSAAIVWDSRRPRTARTSWPPWRGTLDADVDLSAGTVSYRGYTTSVRAYPVGVDWANPLLRIDARVRGLPHTRVPRPRPAVRRASRRRRRSTGLHERHQREAPRGRAPAEETPRAYGGGSCSCRLRSRAGAACPPTRRPAQGCSTRPPA